MIRTRDFILFIVTLLFLLSAIAVTLIKKDKDTTLSSGEIVSFLFQEEEPDALAEKREISREENIERLRQKIMNTSQVIEPEPSVEAPTSSSDAITGTTSAEVGKVTLKKCIYPDDTLSLVPKWPFREVKTNIKDGKRIYYVTKELDIPEVTVSSTTSSSTDVIKREVVTKIVLELPLYPVIQTEPVCVPSEVIGVTTEGLLIFNSAVATYIGQSSQTLIGYARDGFPIYGKYDGEVDECGGYDPGSGYRYSVSSDRPFIIGCYKAKPSTFQL